MNDPRNAPPPAPCIIPSVSRQKILRSIIGIASTWSNVTPCNMHIDKLALESEKGTNADCGKAIVFNTITISDGRSP